MPNTHNCSSDMQYLTPHTKELSPELLFLIACCQSEPDIREICLLIQNNPSLLSEHVSLHNIASHHGILPLLYKTLKKISCSADTGYASLDPLLTELKVQYQSIAQHNMLMSAELIRIIGVLKKNDIEALAFKGPGLSQIAYGDITLRQYSDLDILIQRKDFRFLSNEMLIKGYQPLYPIETFTQDKVMFEMNNDCPFYDKKRSLAVEIHWDFFRKLALPTQKFFPWKNTQSININGYTVKTLSHETHLLYHSLHGSKHVWERLEWVVDIDRLIRAVPELDWDKTLKMAKNMGTEKMFLFGVALAKRYFHTPLPQKVLQRCQALELEPFIIYVESEFNSNDPAPEDSLVKLSKVVGLRDNLYYKSITLLEFLLRPGINERRTIILPDRLFWLYWIIRPIGMAYRFLFCRLLKLCHQETS